MKEIYLAGGCFWGVQHFLDQFDGVEETEAGYADGPENSPGYEDVCAGSGHAETVKVVYDDSRISLTELLEYYFMVIDPLSVNRQGNDRGIQYRTGIYYAEEDQLDEIRQVYDAAAEVCRIRKGDSFERAVAFLTKLMMGHGFRTNEMKVGWKNDIQGREAAYAAKGWCDTPGRIWKAAERLRGVQIENRPAMDVITRFNYPNVLIYADPPYLLGTRHGKQYQHEMDDRDHAELLEALKAHRGPVLLSGYESELYQEELKDWHREEITTRAQTATLRKEILWMNFEPLGQISLFKAQEAEA